MKGFIEVHGKDNSYLLNANSIEYITSVEKGTQIQTRRGEKYIVKEDYETVKSLILSALTPSFTVIKEHDDDRS